MKKSNILTTLFSFFNKLFMVPMFRLGLGTFVGNPFTGYIMVIKTIGRKTGKTRYTPVNYAIMNGSVYCLSGWGETSQWYRNIKARPFLEMLLPGGSVAGTAEIVADADESLRATRQVLKSSGFAGFFLGFNPFTASDETVREKTKETSVMRIKPAGIGSGAADSGGLFWLLIVIAIIGLVFKFR